jgi:hypothetical protein
MSGDRDSKAAAATGPLPVFGLTDPNEQNFIDGTNDGERASPTTRRIGVLTVPVRMWCGAVCVRVCTCVLLYRISVID